VKELVTFHVLSVKWSIKLFWTLLIIYCVPDIMSHLYLLMYYLTLQVKICNMMKGNTTFAHTNIIHLLLLLIQTSNSLPSIFPSSLPFTDTCYTFACPFSFRILFWIPSDTLTSSYYVLFQSSISFLSNKGLCLRLYPFSNANNHCHPFIPCSSLFVFALLFSI
jgi:hypothetical protein